MSIKRLLAYLVGLSIVIGLAFAAYQTQDQWKHLLVMEPQEETHEEDPVPIDEPEVLKLSAQARSNLGLLSKPLKLESYWRHIEIPGVIVDRPGFSDRGVTSPVVGVVANIYSYAGDTVQSGEKQFTLRIFSEYMQKTQSELYKATQEIQLIKEEINRLKELADSGAIAGRRLIELNQQVRRRDVLIQAFKQDLLTRGLQPDQIEGVSQGKFVSTVDVYSPQAANHNKQGQTQDSLDQEDEDQLAFEVQELKVELGQQVQAGQLLSVLSNHKQLYIEGHAFKQEASLLEQVTRQGWPVKVDFTDDDSKHWSAIEQSFQIRHLSNSIDPTSRTFGFFIPLVNQSRTYQKSEETFVVWRFRPGQRVRLQVPLEQLEDVFVLPSAAVAKEGPEAYVFRQNGELFKRFPVTILHEDRHNIVIANDGSVTLGSYFAQSSAASLNRVLKAQAASGIRADVHVHADGTVHASH